MLFRPKDSDWRELFRFGIAGVIATCLHYVTYWGFSFILPLWIAYTIGYLCSLIANFFLSARYTFKSTISFLKAGGFILSHAINYTLHIVLFESFLHIGLSKEFAPILVYCIVIPINFVLVRTVFKKLK